MMLTTHKTLHDCPSCRCDPAAFYDGWTDLQQQFPGVRTVDELKVRVREEYRRDHPARWKNCTSDEAVESAVKAYEPYIRAHALADARSGVEK